jgi:hypothetical protein
MVSDHHAFWQILHAFLICSMYAACPTHLILLDLITLVTFGTNYEAPHYALFPSVLTLPLSVTLHVFIIR